MKSSNIEPLKPCPMCDTSGVIASYEENRRYRYKCNKCGQYFEFNAPSRYAADIVFNYVMRGKIPGQELDEIIELFIEKNSEFRR